MEKEERREGEGGRERGREGEREKEGGNVRTKSSEAIPGDDDDDGAMNERQEEPCLQRQSYAPVYTQSASRTRESGPIYFYRG